MIQFLNKTLKYNQYLIIKHQLISAFQKILPTPVTTSGILEKAFLLPFSFFHYWSLQRYPL